jgi:hypothetical protein
LNQAKPVPLWGEAHGFGVDGNQRPKGDVGRQIMLMQENRAARHE